MQNESIKVVAQLAGSIIAFLIVGVFSIVVTPWFTLGSINRLFDLSIQHSFMNYVYFWVILIAIRFPPLRLKRENE